MKEIEIDSLNSQELYNLLTSTITPRPIAFVSTKDSSGQDNLSPFSFFNVFSVTPPVVVFSPVNRISDDSKKDTLKNVINSKECVIALANTKIVQQVSLASGNYDSNIDEFKKAGFTKKKATLIDVNLINEAPVNFECKVTQIVELGSKGGAGNLVICEILKIHIDENVFDHDNKIDPLKLDIVSRLGLSWYGRTSVDSIFKIAKPMSSFGIGFDNLPNEIIESKVFTGHDLAMLASVDSIPAKKNKESLTLKTEEKHILAKKILKQGKIKEAWEILI
ncbi:MAG: flavin reductase [Flavobacteriales bacterium]|nr:flavin reductase [Flavobacteriales bacterium]|tara:strand:- start:1002 stop:1835 length:834 start_codon:yes stop_codon:yes gene_type:complete